MESDPYRWPGSDCLRNRLDIRESQRLRGAEGRIAAARDAEIAVRTLPGDFGPDHLKAFHRRLFGDVYDWAGATRTVDISKGPGSTFAHWRYVVRELAGILGRLRREDSLLVGLNRPAFVEALSRYYGEINACHPFREGNGRAQRSFLRQLAAAAGWSVDWSQLAKEANDAACAENLRTVEAAPLIAVLDPITTRI